MSLHEAWSPMQVLTASQHQSEIVVPFTIFFAVPYQNNSVCHFACLIFTSGGEGCL